MDQKKFTQIAIILVAAVWVFCGTFMISAKIIKEKKAVTPAPQIQTTTAPNNTVAPATTTAPSTTAPNPATTIFPMGGNVVSTTVTVGDPQWLIDQQASIEASKKAEEEEKNSIVPKNKKEIVDSYVKGINKLKDEKNVTVEKASTLEFAVDQVALDGKSESVSNPTILNVVSNFLNSNKPADVTYNFVNGLDAATGQTPLTAIAPLGAYAKLDVNAVKSATAEKTIGGGYKLTIVLVDEKQTRDAAAPNHATTVEVIDVAGLMPADASLNYLNILYSGTILEATFNSEERLTSVKHKLPVSKADGEGSMKLPLMGTHSASMEMHGEYNCTYTIKY